MAREDFSSEVIFIRDQHNKKESSTKICRRRTFQDEVTDVKNPTVGISLSFSGRERSKNARIH